MGCLIVALLSLLGQPSLPLDVWKFKLGDSPKFAAPGLDDSKWEEVRLPHQFKRKHCWAWYRAVVTIPPQLAVSPLRAKPLAFKCFVDDGGEIYVNGGLENRFTWDGGMVLLTKRARPGQKFVIAVRAYNAGGPGGMGNASLKVVDTSPVRFTVHARKGLPSALPLARRRISRLLRGSRPTRSGPRSEIHSCGPCARPSRAVH